MQSITFNCLGKKCLSTIPYVVQNFIPNFEIPDVKTGSYQIESL